MAVLTDLTIDPQGTHAHWCWASVTAGVCQFLERHPFSMEQVVIKCLNDSACGNQPTPPACDVGLPVDDALTAVGHLGQELNGVMSFAELQQQIDTLQMPVAIEVTFSSPVGDITHACLIKGCLLVDGSEEVILLDPSNSATGESQLSLNDLLSGAVLGGPWTDTFTTK